MLSVEFLVAVAGVVRHATSPPHSHSAAACAGHTSAGDCWLVIHGKVYDVSQFMSDHPGGPESMLEFAGRDATGGFEDSSHSSSARKMMAKYLIGLAEGGAKGGAGAAAAASVGAGVAGGAAGTASTTYLAYLLPILVLLLALYWQFGR